MNQLDNEFFETYKRLDNICRDMYNAPGEYKAGVKMYLEDMEKNFSQGVCMIPEWEAKFRALKRCKRIRDNLAHSEYYPPQGMSSQEDIAFVKSFYQDIMDQTDPLAVLEKYEKQSYGTSHPVSHQFDHYEENDGDSYDKRLSLFAIILFVCIGIVALLIFGIFYAMLSSDSLLGVF